MKITKTRLAEQDLIDIWLYSYTQWDESLADEYLDQLGAGINHLLENRQLGKDYQTIRVLHETMNIDTHL